MTSLRRLEWLKFRKLTSGLAKKCRIGPFYLAQTQIRCWNRFCRLENLQKNTNFFWFTRGADIVGGVFSGPFFGPSLSSHTRFPYITGITISSFFRICFYVWRNFRHDETVEVWVTQILKIMSRRRQKRPKRVPKWTRNPNLIVKSVSLGEKASDSTNFWVFTAKSKYINWNFCLFDKKKNYAPTTSEMQERHIYGW